MEVRVAEKFGFCAGVKNAIKMAQETLREHGKIYSLGPIIHNNDVVAQLAEQGLCTVDSIDQIEKGTVLIRSHGATREQLEKLRQKKLGIVDATCVLVKRLQKISSELRGEGYEVVIIGDRNHPEVKAVVGSTEGVFVVGKEEDVANLPVNSKLGIICQTTQSPEHFSRLLAAIAASSFVELKVINTLCLEARRRQESAVELCRQVDIMFVLGGLHSANTKKLAELCKKYNNDTFHLQNWSELDTNALSGKMVAGVTAGASTPDWVIEEFVRRLREYQPE